MKILLGKICKSLGVSAVSLVIGFFSIALAQAENEPTPEQDWATTGMTMEFVASQLSQANCYRSDREFIGCMDAINSILKSQDPAMELSWNGSRLSTVARVEEPDAQNLSVAEWLRRDRSRKDREFQMWTSALRSTNTRTGRIDTARMILAEGAKVATAKRPMIAGEAMNTFFIAAIDPHTYFMPTVTSLRERISSSESFVGIGVQVEKVSGRILVIRVIPGGAAESADFQEGDAIVGVDGVPVPADESLNDTIQRIRGAEGTTVGITLQRYGQTLEKNIVRRRVVTQNISSRLINDSVQNANYIYIRIESFMSSSTCEDFEAAYLSHARAGAKGLIVDVRGNGGGSVGEVVCIASLLVQRDNGLVMSVQDPATNRDTGSRYNMISTQTEITLPLIVLTSAGSASASEVLAGVIQDYERGIIVGERTFGKGTIQNLGAINEVPGVTMGQTIGRFHLPSGRSNQLVGVLPDVEGYRVPNPTADEQIRMREEDLYRFPIQAVTQSRRPSSQAQSVTTCLRGQTRAASDFGRSGVTNSRDFQLLLAKDAMECMIP